MVILSSARRIFFGIDLAPLIPSKLPRRCRGDKRHGMPDRFLILGHRGSPKRFPENTLASFEETLRAGADGFETDLRLLSDRTAVLFHDDDVGDVEVETLSASDVAADLVDALAQF